MIVSALGTAWDWYYGSGEEQAISECEFKEPYVLPVPKENFNSDYYPQPPTKKVNEDRVVRRGKLSDGTDVNIYSIQLAKSYTNFENNVKFLKILRHPNIIRYLNDVTTETDSHLVTEAATPLALLLDEMDANEICSGLHDIAHAIKFLHSQAKVSHNNISIGSIYVSEKGSWKLGDFDFSCSFSDVTNRNIFHPECLMKPSYLKTLPKQFDKKYAHCGDVNAFGLMLQAYKTKLQFATGLSNEKLTRIISDITREDHENRPTMAEVITMPVLKSNFIYIINFLQSITLKQKSEKEAFFKKLLQMAADSKIFANVFSKCIVPLLLTPIVLAEQSAIKHVINRILRPKSQGTEGGYIPDDVFAEFVIPKIVELFRSRILHVRMTLLEHLENYVHLFEKSVLEEFVLPEIIQGMSDSNNELVRVTLIALAQTIPVVGAEVIVGEERERIFSHATPKFNGNMLNGQSVLAHQEEIRFPTREPLPLPVDEGPKKKPTLLEVAQRMKLKNKLTNVKKMEIMEKQKYFANMFNRKPVGMLRRSLYQAEAEPKIIEPEKIEEISAEEKQKEIMVEEEKVAAADTTEDILEKLEKQRDIEDVKVAKVNDQVEVETWAQSDDEDDDGWQDFDVKQDEEPSNNDDVSKDEDDAALTVVTKTPCINETTPVVFEDELGSEFSITPKVPTVDPEPDYFAGMEPEIPVAAPEVASPEKPAYEGAEDL